MSYAVMPNGKIERTATMLHSRGIPLWSPDNAVKGTPPCEGMTIMTLQTKLQEIKHGFRPVMNGEVARSMREKGVEYKLNWGVSLTELRRIAEHYGKDYDLAVALWKEDIRECKILATLIMPAERMQADLAELWMEQTTTQEIAEMAAFNLYQHLKDASLLAFRWIASDKELWQISGYHILTRLLMRGYQLMERDANELADQAHTAMLSTSLAIRHAAYTCSTAFHTHGCIAASDCNRSRYSQR